MNSSDEKHSIDEKDLSQPQDGGVRVSVEDVDTGAMLAAGVEGTLDPAEAAKIRKKIDLHIIPLMCILYWVQYMDKATLGSSSILGIKCDTQLSLSLPVQTLTLLAYRQATHLNTDEYNWLSTCFYLAYLVMEFPQNLALQRFPVAKWLSINIFVWGVALCSHAACKSFVGLLIVRIILGVCEGSITAGFLIVTAMFYTRKEQGIRAGYWFLMNGAAQIISGFISFGTLHIKTNSLEPWQWLMLITGIITLITAVAFWFLFPDSPTTAWFLTLDERAKAILRIKENQTGLENKHFKKEQMIEALLDPKTWLFALFSALTNVPNSLSNQKSIIVQSFGFTTLQTTLLTMVDGGVEIVTILIGVNVAARTGQRAYTAVIWKIPNIVAAILINTLPWSNKIGLLFSFWIVGWGTTAFVIAVAWLNTVTAGHTKRVTTNAILLIAYVASEMLRPPQMWKDKYKPRNHVPWIIICCCFVSCMVLLLVIRWVLSRENKRRDRQGRSDVSMYDDVYIERLSPDGVLEKVKVDKEL
ncbi:MFS general substrate transporter [Mycena amicta]|nr:MFS general substrate transporter [Mycena amicta]